MVATPILWHGTIAEWAALEAAVAVACACQYTNEGALSERCEPHRAMATDQAWLDRLVCERRRRAELLKQEQMEKDLPC